MVQHENHSKQAIIMEQVAMYMAALPCPPMPLMVSDVVLCEPVDKGEKKSEAKYCNSHDFIASMLLNAMFLGDIKLNEQRKIKQVELTDKLLRQMATDESVSVEKAYNHFSEFTAGYICAFANIDVGVTFLPLDEVKNNDNVHRACCSWNRAQGIILKEPELPPLEQKSFRELLSIHCQRFST